jgi:phospholipid-binding lipoprotein MlaA
MNNNTQKRFSFIVSKIVIFFVFLFATPFVFAEERDPYEGFNRIIFNFNDHLDKIALKPIASFYNSIVPKPLNKGIHNFFNNLGNFPTIANDLLQVDFYQAANDAWRLGINSTIGIAGLFDVAAEMSLPHSTNDFGLTLAKWGYTESNYLVLPFFGPSSIRDAAGLPVDYFAFSIYPHVHPDKNRYALYGLGVVDRRARLLQFQPVMEEAAIDRYVFVRNAYLQHRAYQISHQTELNE